MADLAPPHAQQDPGRQTVSPATRRRRRQIFAITWLAYAAYYFPREAFSVAKLGILDDPTLGHVLTGHALGVLDAVYLAAYAAGQFLWGAWADRFGTRVVVVGGMLGAIAASCVMGVSSAVLVFAAAMVLQGLAQSTGWAPLCRNISNFFPVRERGRVLGFWSTNYAFGGLAAPPVLGWIAYAVFDGYRTAFLAAAGTLAVVLLLFLLFQRNSPRDVGLPDLAEQDAPRERRSLALYRETLREPMVRTLGAAYFLLKPARYAILLWGPVLVSRRLPEVGKVGAAVIPIAFGVAGVLAPIVAGWVSDSLFASRRVPPSVLALALLAVALGLFMPLTATHSVAVMVGLLGVIGLAVYAADAMISCVAAVDFGGSRGGAGTAAGLINGCGSVGAILGGLLPGFLSGSTLFFGFAGAALLAGVLLLPSWNRLPNTGSLDGSSS